jgi:hypothetical protein
MRCFKVPPVADNSPHFHPKKASLFRGPQVEGLDSRGLSRRSGWGGSPFHILIVLLKLTFFRFKLPVLGKPPPYFSNLFIRA